MNYIDVVNYSKHIKNNADKILKTTNLIEILGKYGEVKIGGSYKYNLMWGPDIDMVLVCKDPRKTSVAVLKKLIDLKLFQKYEYGDFVNFKRASRPESYIVNLRLPFEDQKWEIEIWFFNKESNDQKEVDDLIKTKLNEKNKLAILKMKEKRERSGLNKHSLSSFEIYKKVLG